MTARRNFGRNVEAASAVASAFARCNAFDAIDVHGERYAIANPADVAQHTGNLDATFFALARCPANHKIWPLTVVVPRMQCDRIGRRFSFFKAKSRLVCDELTVLDSGQVERLSFADITVGVARALRLNAITQRSQINRSHDVGGLAAAQASSRRASP